MSSSSDYDSLWARSSSPRSDRSTQPSEHNNNDNEDGPCEECDEWCRDSGIEEFPWILYHLLDCEPPVALPVRTMFAFNSGYKLPSVKESHQWWGRDEKGGRLIKFITSLEDQRLTPGEVEQRKSDLDQAVPKDEFSDPVNQHLYGVPIKQCPESMRRPEKHTVPLKTAESFSHMFFTEDYTHSISSMGLTAIDYFQDYEWMRRGRLQAAATRLGINKDNWREVLAKDKLALEWLQLIEKYELEIEVLFANSYLDMRIWVMTKHLQDGNFYKPESMAFLNSLFPPCDRDIASPYNLPNRLIEPRVLAKHRELFFKYIYSVEKYGVVVMDNFVNQLLTAGTKHSWPDTRTNLDKYFLQATSMVEMADAVTGKEFWHERTETELSPHPEAVFARWSLDDQVRKREEYQRMQSNSEHVPMGVVSVTRHVQSPNSSTTSNKEFGSSTNAAKAIKEGFWKLVRRGKPAESSATMISTTESSEDSRSVSPKAERSAPELTPETENHNNVTRRSVTFRIEESVSNTSNGDRPRITTSQDAIARRRLQLRRLAKERIARKQHLMAVRAARDARRAEGKKIMSRLKKHKKLIRSVDPTAKHWLKHNIFWKQNPRDGLTRPTIRVPLHVKEVLLAFEASENLEALQERLATVSPVEPKVWAESNPYAEDLQRRMARRERRGRASYLWEPKNRPGDRPSDESSSSDSEDEGDDFGDEVVGKKSGTESIRSETDKGKSNSEDSGQSKDSDDETLGSGEEWASEEDSSEAASGEDQPSGGPAETENQDSQDTSEEDESDNESVDLEVAHKAAHKIGKYLTLTPEPSPTTPTTPSMPFGRRKMHSTPRVVKLAESALTYVLEEEDEETQPSLPQDQGAKKQRNGDDEVHALKKVRSFGRLALKFKTSMNSNAIVDTIKDGPRLLRKQKSLPAISTSKSTPELQLPDVPQLRDGLNMGGNLGELRKTMENTAIDPEHRQQATTHCNTPSAEEAEEAEETSVPSSQVLSSNTSNEAFVLGKPPSAAAQKAKKLNKAASSQSLVSIPESTKSSTSVETVIHRPATPSKSSILSPWVSRMRRAKSEQDLIHHPDDVVITGDDMHDPMPSLSNLQAYISRAGAASSSPALSQGPSATPSPSLSSSSKNLLGIRKKEKKQKKQKVEEPIPQTPPKPTYRNGFPGEAMDNASCEEERQEILRRYLIDKSKRERAEMEAEMGAEQKKAGMSF